MTTLAERWEETEPTSSPFYCPSETAETFIRAFANGPTAEMRMLILMGPRGEGKTSAGIFADLALAERLRRDGQVARLPIIVACVRDTFRNLERTTLVSFQENQQKGLPIQFLDGGSQAVIAYDRPLLHYYFFGLDRPEDMDKLQGFQCGCLWLEEVAPAAGISSGIRREVLIGVTSVRQAGIPARVKITMNPPDRQQWVLKVEDYLAELNLPEIRVVRFTMPPGEKARHFRELAAEAQSADEARAWTESAEEFEAYRTRNRVVLEAMGRPDLVARLVSGQIEEVQLGQAVCRPFVRARHVAPEALAIVPGVPIIRCWDGGGTPSCVWMQDLPGRGGINVLMSRTAEEAGLEEFIDREVIPLQGQYGISPRQPLPVATAYGPGNRGGFTFRDIGDPSMRDEGKTARAGGTLSKIIEAKLATTFEPGPVPWPDRRESMLATFQWNRRGGDPFVLLDPEENDLLIEGLGGKFYYPLDPRTSLPIYTIEAAKKVSGLFAQPTDALFYGLAVLYPVYERLKQHNQQPAPRPKRPRTWLGR